MYDLRAELAEHRRSGIFQSASRMLVYLPTREDGYREQLLVAACLFNYRYVLLSTPSFPHTEASLHVSAVSKARLSPGNWSPMAKRLPACPDDISAVKAIRLGFKYQSRHQLIRSELEPAGLGLVKIQRKLKDRFVVELLYKIVIRINPVYSSS